MQSAERFSERSIPKKNLFIPMGNWVDLSDADRDADIRNEFQITIIRSIRKGLDSTWHLQEYTKYRMGVKYTHKERTRSRVSPYARRLIAIVWRMTESPNIAERGEASVKNIAVRSSEDRKVVGVVLSDFIDTGHLHRTVDTQDKRRRLYAISDRFVASGLLLGSYPQVWLEQFRVGKVQEELEAAFEFYPIKDQDRLMIQGRLF